MVPEAQTERLIDARAQLHFSEAAITATGFLVVLSLLFVFNLANLRDNSCTNLVAEKRKVSILPPLKCSRKSIDTFRGAFENFYNDRLFLRETLISWDAILKFRYFQQSRSDQVLIGSDDWMFFFDDGDKEILRRSPLMTRAEILSWVKMLNERKCWCEQHGIRFYFTVAPTKSTIYREYVPPQYTALNKQTRTDQLYDFLRKHTDIQVIDMRPALMANKKNHRLYFKTDSHWNRIGALIGYQSIIEQMKKTFAGLTAMGLDEMHIACGDGYGGDLLDISGLRDGVSESFEEIKPRCTQTWSVSKFPPPPKNIADQSQRFTPFATDNPKGYQLKTFFIRDSFFLLAQQFISQTFQRACFFWHPTYAFPTELIAKEKPDVIVMEMVERHLAKPAPANPNWDECD